jgi:hypothetical protein
MDHLKQPIILLFIFCIGVGAAAYLHWPALTNHAVYKSDLRQAPHWSAYHHDDSFRDDDIFIQYSQYNESPIQNLIYYTGTYFLDIIPLSKVLAVLSYGFGALLFYAAGKALFGTYGGLLSAVFFAFFPNKFDWSAGFFSKFWMVPLLLVCILVLTKKKWRALPFLIPFAGLAYPPAAVLISTTVLIYLILELLENKNPEAAIIFKYLLAGSSIALLILLSKYLWPPSFIGPMTSQKELLNMEEMYKGGITATTYLPTPSLFKELLRRISHPFIMASTIFYLFILGRKNIGWHRSWTALFLASIICYLLADLFFMRMYIPNRYTRYSVAVLLVLWNGHNCSLMLERISQKWLRLTALLTIFAVAAYFYGDTFDQQRNSINRQKLAPLCRFIGHLPQDVLIAGPPRILDDIPIQSKRSVFSTYKLAHPWFSKYYSEIKKRTLATYRALYADTIGPINDLYYNHGVTHLIIKPSSYTRKNLKKRKIYVKPYNREIKKMIGGKKKFILQSPPEANVIYSGKRYTIIKLPLPDADPPGTPTLNKKI